MSKFKTILVEKSGRVATVTLNRPDSLNALNALVMKEIVAVCRDIDNDPEIAVVILTGAGRAFAAGADIKEMEKLTFSEAYKGDLFAGWEDFARKRKPWIAAVNGFALGGGCEVAMMCDILIASEKAKFGQPEIKLGLLPGMGGSQRLTKAVGKPVAMDMILTGRMIDGAEAHRIGLVSRLFAPDELMAGAQEIAQTIAGYGIPAIIANKEVVDVSQEVSLADGLRHERRLSHALFATDDQKEGMGAFVQKRDAKFTDK